MAERPAPFASDYGMKPPCEACGKPKPIMLTVAKIGGGYELVCSGCALHRGSKAGEDPTNVPPEPAGKKGKSKR